MNQPGPSMGHGEVITRVKIHLNLTETLSVLGAESLSSQETPSVLGRSGHVVTLT